MSRKRSIVCIDQFIEATRDSGYKGTAHAVSELVDNSIQAGAGRVTIAIEDPRGQANEILVLDDGRGMDADELWQALQFGGSSRFDDRSGLGRYGMGLPNASLSQARRVEVFSWRDRGSCLKAVLDVDLIQTEGRTHLSSPDPSCLEELPFLGELPPHGTLVRLMRADRLDAKRSRTIARRLEVHLGRVYRHSLWDGVEIVVNGSPVVPIDPLFLSNESRTTGATVADNWTQEFRVPGSGDGETAVVSVRFSKLPVGEWAHLPTEEKRALGISNGAGVSVVRAGREIDYGWFFLRGRRRQNYDDWWRCEVCFEPALDELFGITHTKQQVRPSSELLEYLSPPMIETAARLHAEVRAEYARNSTRSKSESMEVVAAQRDLDWSQILSGGSKSNRSVSYRIDEAATVGDFMLFDAEVTDDELVARINPQHAFYQQIYKPLTKATRPSPAGEGLKALLLAMARAEILVSKGGGEAEMRDFRRHLSHALGEFLRK